MNVDDTRAIWVQLVEEFRRRIAAGQWQPGQRIQSVRELAVEAGVNPNTVQRALSETDRLGLTATERTSGRFVTSDPAMIAEARAQLAQATTDSYIDAIRGIGYDLDSAAALLASRWPTDPQRPERTS